MLRSLRMFLQKILFSVLLPGLALSPAATGSEKLFLDNCAVCHQRDGKGIPQVYPDLTTSEVVRGSAVDVALVLLIGRGEMPSFKGALSSADMAAIINYVRSTFATQDDGITAERIDTLQ